MKVFQKNSKNTYSGEKFSNKVLDHKMLINALMVKT